MPSSAHPVLIANPLLGPTDPPVTTLCNPSGAARVLLCCDHAGQAVPAALNDLGLAPALLDRHIAYDIGAAEVTRHLADMLDAPAVLGGYSRLVIDLNRPLDDPTSIAAVSDGIAVPGNQDLDAAARTRRAQTFFHPYHTDLAGRLTAARNRGVVPALLSIHSFTPVMDGDERPWHIGVLWNRDDRIAGPLMHRLRQGGDRLWPGLCIGDNQPYSARASYGYTMAVHAESVGLPHVLVEIRQDLIDTATGQATWAGILGRVLQRVLAYDGIYRLEVM